MRFRLTGKNWEGRTFFTCRAISKLATQIDEDVDYRYVTDGTVASKGHDAASPGSDHRPKPTKASPGIVRAIDAGGTTKWLAETTEALRLSKDRRIKYVIHNGRIFTYYERYGIPPFTWRPYPGSPHKAHFHLSVREKYERDQSDWNIKTGDDDMTILTDQQQEELQKFLQVLEERNSNVTFAGFAVDLIRKEREFPLNEASAVAVQAELDEVKEKLRSV